MLLRSVAIRAIKPSLLPTRAVRHTFPATTLHIRAYADRPRRPPPPPPPVSTRPIPRSSPSPHSVPPTSGQVRQTSPGTSVPEDQTWKPKDAITFAAGSAAAPTPSAAHAIQTPVQGSRPVDETTRSDSPLEEEAQLPHQPVVAQEKNVDDPVPQSARDVAQRAQAAAENTAPPSKPPASGTPEEESVEQVKPSQPLPDLRHGIPSTFDLEFGAGRQQQQQQANSPQGEARPPPQGESEEPSTLDVTTSSPSSRQQRGERGDREDREYDRSAYETSLDRRRAKYANYLYASILSLGLLGALYLARPFSTHSDLPSALDPDNATGWSPPKLYARIRARLGNSLGYYTEPTFPKLLPEVPESQRPPFTLVLSLEDLLIHSAWDRKHGYRVARRPGVDYFIRYLLPYYELVLFTTAPLAVADQVVKKLDPYHFIQWPLGREATKYEGGEYVKDLSYLNRDLSKTLIIDTDAAHVKNQPENAILLPKWTGDVKDAHTKDLVALIPFLEYVATMGIEDVRAVLKSFEGTDIPVEFARREAEARQKFQEQFARERAKRPKLSLGALASSGLGVKSSPGIGMAGGAGGGGGGTGMVFADGSSVAEGLAQGKMLSDQIREQGQKQYEQLEKQIREHGAQWLKDEEEEQKKAMEAQMKEVKKGALSWFGGGGGAATKE